MYFTYVLYSKEHSKIYIGFTSNLESRFKSHNELATKGWTIKYRPWKILFYEEYSSKNEAITREKSLKSGQGREYIWNLIRQDIDISGRLISA